MKHNVLWTGGWDSTFRVLNLVIDKNEKVQPYYVLDPVRPSTEMELRTMASIKRQLEKDFPEARKNICSTIEIKKEDIPLSDDFTREYNKLASSDHLGDQYDWLGRYAISENLDHLELAVHLHDKVQGLIQDDAYKVDEENDHYYRVKEEPSRPEYSIFHPYRFPLLELSKLDMEKAAKESGYQHLMEMTWFCHTPKKNGTPCGLCNPCKYTRNEGLQRRVPEPSKAEEFKYFLFKVKRRLKKVL
ncbi:7-cyano-7-deazaguanine synthase [Halobacillus shinanisalinarum]|uniref:7-cyano-7-deazaguanine synthase n=1 Tax=Halobacillus shinanisalinarum TaxID=2932258 RepID=A0ABY4H1Z3_9BACI|nr:7-cyano-7-deazaguanine synthase [Halobacillus shinanisalinarum]UOQ94433.1 7-cyano-7-deazaguanine synthase [Halobacillus shinanisalinarum]